MRLAACLLAMLACGLAGAGPAAAQQPYSDDRFPHLFAPQAPQPTFRLPSIFGPPATAPPQIITIPQRSRPAVARPSAQQPETTRPPRERLDAAPSPEQTTTVLVLGDNLAEWLAYGLQAAFEDVPEVGILDRSRLGAGFLRSDTQDLSRAVADYLAQTPQVDIIVVLAGLNDRVPTRTEAETETAEPRSERWREIYVAKVDAALALLKARGVPVFWVGLPPVRGQRSMADMSYLNEIFRERAAARGVTFLDVWDGFVNEQGQYAQFGPDVAGQTRRLRTADGVHFTPAGGRKLALAVEQELRREILRRASPLVPGADRPGLEPAPAPSPFAAPDATAPDPTPPRPLAGPILPLAGNPNLPRSPGSAERAAPALLAGGQPSQGAPSAAAVVVRGEAPAPVAGRIDDFRWPRPQ